LSPEGNCLFDRHHSCFHGAKIVAYENTAHVLRKTSPTVTGCMKQQNIG